MHFRDKISRAAETNKTRIVLALDLEDPDPELLVNKSLRVLEDVKGSICAVKINRQLILALGLRRVADTVLRFADNHSLPTIMDAKLNDVGHTNLFMARTYFETGFDAIIASPIVGWENGLDTVFEAAGSTDKAILLLTYMSNPGAEAFYSLRTMQPNGPSKPIFEIFTDLAIKWKAHGLIVGATKREIISRVRDLTGGSLPIYSPGVGAQGGDPRKTILAGSAYLIVGRSIYGASDCGKAAESIRRAAITD